MSGPVAKPRHTHRFLIPADPALTIGCVKGGEAINVVTSKTPFTEPIGKSDTAEWGGWETSWPWLFVTPQPTPSRIDTGHGGLSK
jgi:hypothetical protein